MQERMTSKEYLKQYGNPSPSNSKKKNPKYRNIKTKRHGIVFDSEKEANRYDELLLLERCKLLPILEDRLDSIYIKTPSLFMQMVHQRSLQYMWQILFTLILKQAKMLLRMLSLNTLQNCHSIK